MGKQEIAEQVGDETRIALTQDEIIKAYKGFIADYPEGKITHEKLKEIYSRIPTTTRNGDSGDFIEHVFRTFDENGDGMINFKEFVVALSMTRRSSLSTKLSWIFSVYDIDSNGYISKEEMKEVLVSVYKMSATPMGSYDNKGLSPQQRIEKIYRLMDKNDDEKLSLKEFMEGVRKNPSVEALLS